MSLILAAALLLANAAEAPASPAHTPAMAPVALVQHRLRGTMGDRVRANLDAWVLRAPGANPALLELLRRRDRAWPHADIVPWAGEFPGKFLTAAVPLRRLTEDPRLDTMLVDFVGALVDAQAADGYLGPFRKAERWMGHWDLWGHYHVALGLLDWFDETGDPRAQEAVRRMIAGICDRYADGDRRPIDAGTPETNLALLHVLARVHTADGDPRVGALIARIEEDLAQGGDWLRLGAEGTPYHALPRNGTRWESLHILQGFVARHRATGEARYRDAAWNLWKSLRDHDRHPSGAVTTAEGAKGTIFEPGAVETCCSIAWLALGVDLLGLTGDPTVADELELTTWNQGIAALHPSGSWCTYDTPMNGARSPAYHQINFQQRVGGPELNCCSVNGPRALGLLSDWALMEDDAGLYVNYYGPGAAVVRLRDGRAFVIAQETAYPAEGTVRITVTPQQDDGRLELRLRIPAWSRHTEAVLDGEAMAFRPSPGSYLRLGRDWKSTGSLTLHLDMQPRSLPGGPPACAGRAAFYHGPLLLAFDPYYNAVELADLPPIDTENFQPKPVAPPPAPRTAAFPPIGLWEVATRGGGTVTLCDFASAGAHGTAYAAWLPVSAPQEVAE
jgi:hypothetical protein